MNPSELEQMRKAQRRDLAVIVLAGVVLIFLVRATEPEPIPVPTGPGNEICMNGSC